MESVRSTNTKEIPSSLRGFGVFTFGDFAHLAGLRWLVILLRPTTSFKWNQEDSSHRMYVGKLEIEPFATLWYIWWNLVLPLLVASCGIRELRWFNEKVFSSHRVSSPGSDESSQIPVHVWNNPFGTPCYMFDGIRLLHFSCTYTFTIIVYTITIKGWGES